MGFLKQAAALGFLLILSLLPVQAFNYESPNEFTGTGDFDGDGREDVVVVDKASGNYRIGYQLSPGSHTWSAARGSGVGNVTGFSVGRLLHAGRDALAFTATDANRINILGVENPALAGQPVSAFPPGVGPNLVIALDIGGAGNTALADLFTGTTLNSGSFPDQATLLRNNAGSVSPLMTTPSAGPMAAGNVVTLKSGAPPLAGFTVRAGASDIFRAYFLTNGSFVPALQLTGLPDHVGWVHAPFAGGPLAQFLFYQSNDTNGVLRLRSVTEAPAHSFHFAPEVAFQFGVPLRQVQVVSGAGPHRLLIFFGDGEAAALYSFDGVSEPTLTQAFTAAAGEHLTGATPMANGSFMLLSAAAGSATSSKFQTYNFNGTDFVAGQSGNLPSLTTLSGRANIFEFQFEPFVNGKPNLLRVLQSSDWSTHLRTQSLPQLVVATESFAGPTAGLENPTTNTIAQANPLTHFGLVNQYGAPMSLFSAARPLGDEVADVRIQPPPGRFASSVKVTFVAAAGLEIRYRIHPSGDWISFNGSPLSLFEETTLSYYAKPAVGTAKSTIRHATYQFTEPASTLDSDGDGVPDYVELARGLDPKKGADSDGDGYSDLEELLGGSNPGDKSSLPAARPLTRSAFNLIETPRPVDGVAGTLTTSQTNVLLRTYDLSGALLRSAATSSNAPFPGVLVPAAALSNIVIDARQRLLSVATPGNFAVHSTHTNTLLGRELLALVPLPELPSRLDVPYSYAGGALLTEASNWIASAQAAQGNLAAETHSDLFDHHDTLAALVVERKVGDILVSRGLSAATNFTLFPYRSADASRLCLTPSLLEGLEALGANSEPAYRLRHIYRTVTNALWPPSGFNTALRNVASEIYRISSALGDSEPGRYASPVAALRQFLATGLLESNYLAHTSLNAGDLAGAAAATTQILVSIGARPTANLTLVVRPDTFEGSCTVLDSLAGGNPRSLFHPSGIPFRLLETLDLPPGSQIQVYGFTDLPSGNCPGDPIEVISLSLGSVPAVTSLDQDGDLLLDELEMLLFGGLQQNGLEDGDGDNITNLQEMFDGTDPSNVLSKAAQIQDVAPNLVLEAGLGAPWQLTWDWPAAYAGKVSFKLLTCAGLGQPWVETPLLPVHLGGGQWQANIAAGGTPAQFYQLQLTLK